MNKVTYKYSKNEILLRIFKGSISVHSIINSWKDVITDKRKYKGVITDYRYLKDENILVDVDDISEFTKYIKLNIEFFKSIRFAVVVNSPKIAIPMILKNNFPELKFETFSTIEAAVEWVGY